MAQNRRRQTPMHRRSRQTKASLRRSRKTKRRAAAGLIGSRRFGRALIVGLLLAAATVRGTAATSHKAFQFALQNGMQVVVIPDHRAPVVTQMIWFKVGAADDPPGLGGLAHFFEHMMFRGTKSAPGEQYAQTIARNGGEENAFTTHDYTCFYEQIAKDRLKLAMSLEA